MKITDILEKYKTTLSFEVFPPKTSDKYESVEHATAQIAKMRPDFMSVTYGAGGGTSKFTVDIAKSLKNNCGVTPLAHLTCVSSDRDTVRARLDDLEAAGIENILALRGDVPADAPSRDEWHYTHANELMQEISARGSFCIGGACYPEGHPESKNLDEDIENLKLKLDAGCSFLTTQMFFDNYNFYRFMEKARASGIYVPIIAGIMPITNAKSIRRSCELSGTEMPRKFLNIAGRYGDDPESMLEAGIVYAEAQIIDLFANGIKHVHVYTMNKPEVAARIRQDLSHIIPVHEQ